MSRKATKDIGNEDGHTGVQEVHVEEGEEKEVGHTTGNSQERQEEEEEEEIIRCVCNIYRDEGLMIQCEKCEVSRHRNKYSIYIYLKY